MRGLAHLGIIALVDEATGYQRDRARDALTKILEAFIAKELQPWLPTFPADFYQEMFRLRGMDYPNDTTGTTSRQSSISCIHAKANQPSFRSTTPRKKRPILARDCDEEAAN